MARTFQLVKKIPPLRGLAGDGEDFSSQFFDWINSATGKDVIANAANIISHEAGIQPIYRTPSGAYATPRASIDPMLLLAGGAVLFLLLRK